MATSATNATATRAGAGGADSAATSTSSFSAPSVADKGPIFYSASEDGARILRTKEDRYKLPDGTSFHEFASGKAWQRPPHKLLDKGGSSSVYKLEFADGQQFILKVITKGLSRAIQTEIARLVQLRGKWFAVQIIAAIVYSDNNGFILFPYIPGELLFTMITTDYKPPSTAITAERQRKYNHVYNRLVQATLELHQMGIVHHDIKPENVWITTDGEPFFLDFGSAENIGNLSQARGTKPYLPIHRWRFNYYGDSIPMPVTVDINWHALGESCKYYAPHETYQKFLRPGITDEEAAVIKFEGGSYRAKRHTRRKRKSKKLLSPEF
jgi:serine/threonine protein kinase